MRRRDESPSGVLPISAIALAALDLRLGLAGAILLQRAADVVALGDPPLRIPADVPRVPVGLDQLALAGAALGRGFLARIRLRRTRLRHWSLRMEKRSSNYPFARAADPIGDLTPPGTPKATRA